MPKKLIDVIEHKDMVDEVYLEEDRTYFHDIYYKEDKPDSSNIGEQQN